MFSETPVFLTLFIFHLHQIIMQIEKYFNYFEAQTFKLSSSSILETSFHAASFKQIKKHRRGCEVACIPRYPFQMLTRLVGAGA